MKKVIFLEGDNHHNLSSKDVEDNILVYGRHVLPCPVVPNSFSRDINNLTISFMPTGKMILLDKNGNSLTERLFRNIIGGLNETLNELDTNEAFRRSYIFDNDKGVISTLRDIMDEIGEIRKECNGYVYFIKDSHNLVKIGRTGNIRNRLKKYITENSSELELIHIVPSYNCVSLESDMHSMFENKRVRGEWFDLDENDIRYILQIRDDD